MPPAGAAVAARSGAPPWDVRDAAHVDLWFHALATIGFDGGERPLYDPGYGARARRAKVAAGVYPTALDRRAPALRAALRRDRAFDVLHFLPLYFVDAGRGSMLEALDAVARGQTAGDPRARRAAAAIAAALPEASQRRVLGELARLVEGEWREYFGPASAASAGERQRATLAARHAWTVRLAAPLAPFLDARGVRRGTIVLSAVLGAEGRIVAPAPGQSPGSVLVVVQAPRSDGAEDAIAPAFHTLRELCFPVARAVVADAAAAAPAGPRHGTTDDDDDARATALAERCGALALARYAAPLRAGYEAELLRGSAPLGRRNGTSVGARAIPVSADLERRLAAMLGTP